MADVVEELHRQINDASRSNRRLDALWIGESDADDLAQALARLVLPPKVRTAAEIKADIQAGTAKFLGIPIKIAEVQK